MTFDDYQKRALTTALRLDDQRLNLAHWVLGLSGETGEIAEKFKKIIRDKDGQLSDADVQDFKKELGDVMWYLAVLAEDLGLSLDEIAKLNLEKLASRQKRGVLRGSGDNR